MSQTLINQYLNQLASLKKVSGSFRECVLREAFKDLLKAWGRQHDLTLIPEYALDTLTKENAMSMARCCIRCGCRLAIGKRRTPRMIWMPKLKRNSSAAIRRTTLF